MARTIRLDDLRDLARLEAEQGPILSFYLDLDPHDTPTSAELDRRLASLLGEAAKMAEVKRREHTHDQRQAVQSDLEHVRQFVKGEFGREGAHGLALFAGELDGVWSPFALLDGVPDTVKLACRPYLVPLLPLVGRGEGAIVVLVGREVGRFFALQQGRLQELADRSEEQPRRHDQGGWAQARLQRHVDTLALAHLREVADELDRRVRHLRGADLVIAASEGAHAALDGMLSQQARAALAGWVPAEPSSSSAELLELVEPILESRRAEREAQLLLRWREEAGRGGRATGGWEETIPALCDGRVETLLASPPAHREIWCCTSCGRLSNEAGPCPIDSEPVAVVRDGLDLAAQTALLSGGTVSWIEGHDLDPAGGIGALLRF